jgi:hypothetical protein
MVPMQTSYLRTVGKYRNARHDSCSSFSYLFYDAFRLKKVHEVYTLASSSAGNVPRNASTTIPATARRAPA